MKSGGFDEAIMAKMIPHPSPIGSYAPSDVIFLLKDISDVHLERTTEEREAAIQSGVHYSEMLPTEYEPSAAYIELFHRTLAESARQVALAAAIVAERILARRGRDVILVSLARGGTPAGILIKRYLAYRYGLDMKHYSVSIIRGKGIDENAILYILQQHGAGASIQFVDGWTGKGAIRGVLMEAAERFERQYGYRMNDDLTVLADPGHCCDMFGTRDDYLIPSACLNATVSGLISRTVQRDDLIGMSDFHGAKFYKEWAASDLSGVFVDAVSGCFAEMEGEAYRRAEELERTRPEATWKGKADVEMLQAKYGIDNVNLVKPGVGETTRVLLRRVPWKIIVNRPDNPSLKHIVLLAEDRGVPIEVLPELTYSCCGIIKPLKGDTE